MNNGLLDRALSITLTVAAVGMAVAVGMDELRERARPVGPPPGSSSPSYVRNWTDLDLLGHRTGSIRARVHLIEFGDLECPACRAFHETTLKVIRQEFPTEVDFTFVHFPLPAHRFANQAAVAADCADRQGSFSKFVELTYRLQDSIGLKPWQDIATAAGARDTVAFNRCIHDPANMKQIDAARATGNRIGIHATPTVLVNGWVTSHSPEELRRVIGEVLKGSSPFPSVDTVKALNVRAR